MKRSICILAAAALAAAFLHAPFAHSHEPGHAERHVAEHHAWGLALHIHLPGRVWEDPVWEEEADRSAFLINWFQMKQSGAAFSAVLEPGDPLPPPIAATGLASEAERRLIRSADFEWRSSRAPPV